jgi:hypothetical protein
VGVSEKTTEQWWAMGSTPPTGVRPGPFEKVGDGLVTLLSW